MKIVRFFLPTISQKCGALINRKFAKISALSSGKVDKYEHLTGEKMLPLDQSRMIE